MSPLCCCALNRQYDMTPSFAHFATRGGCLSALAGGRSLRSSRIYAHKLSAEIANTCQYSKVVPQVFTAMSVSTRFLKLGCPLLWLPAYMLPFHLIPALAIILGAGLGDDNPTVALFLMALTTGTFLYVGAFEVCSEEFGHSHDLPTSSAIGESLNTTVAATDRGVRFAVSEEGRAEDRGELWYPSKAVKFAAFMVGCGAMLAITAALPAHNH